uniref:Uncharacterized protein n=1 Tax=Candidatus Kentrum sp. FW TaxID=2126338 RepID=A0A450U353_9GAMM|nr:MAG: Protein of unknown function DUF86 [Candidatus Kentron sp. FW]
MRHDANICIRDAIDACELILAFTADYSLQQYQADPRTKAAVEREFEIIGEALNSRLTPERKAELQASARYTIEPMEQESHRT